MGKEEHLCIMIWALLYPGPRSCQSPAWLSDWFCTCRITGSWTSSLEVPLSLKRWEFLRDCSHSAVRAPLWGRWLKYQLWFWRSGWDLKFCIANKAPGDACASGPLSTLWVARTYRSVCLSLISTHPPNCSPRFHPCSITVNSEHSTYNDFFVNVTASISIRGKAQILSMAY